jgi:hypothetical protein
LRRSCRRGEVARRGGDSAIDGVGAPRTWRVGACPAASPEARATASSDARPRAWAGVAAALCVLAAIAALAAPALGQGADREPTIGYLYPAGGQRGTTVRVAVGGQYLPAAKTAYVSGEGVRASIVEFVPPLRPLDPEQRRELARQLREAWAQRSSERVAAGKGPAPPLPFLLKIIPRRAARAANPEDAKLPDHPLFRDLPSMSFDEIEELIARLYSPHLRDQQPQRAIAETVIVNVTLDADAPLGPRELRLATPLGLTNPLRFEVGGVPEALEHEPDDGSSAIKHAPLEVPVVVNGQVLAGDVDRTRVRAKQGQHLVISAEARGLVPYLADAVPGWFQATLALYDAQGNEVAYDDDNRFDPDPVIVYDVPRDGDFTVEVRDAIYRGREDFVYRVTVGEQPFVTGAFPLGGREGAPTLATLTGVNLPRTELALDTSPGDALRETALVADPWRSNAINYDVDALAECVEAEPNDDGAAAQAVTLPLIVNGRIGEPGDADVFAFQGRAGQEVVAEVLARRLGSPVDSLLKLCDAAGKPLASNDDTPDEGAGLITHQADSYLTATLPADGRYTVRVADTQHHGGDAYAYRLRLSEPREDFALRMAPSSINVQAGRAAAVTVYALRRDGFDGPIDIALNGAPPGFSLDAARIPAGRDSIRFTLEAPTSAGAGLVALRFEGQAEIAGQRVTRPVEPADDMMQAFIYHHLVPAQEQKVLVRTARRAVPDMAITTPMPVRIPAGGSATVDVGAALGPLLSQVSLELSDPPAGIALADVTPIQGGLRLTLTADGEKAKAGYVDNLIVDATFEAGGRVQDGDDAGKKRRVPMGVLPAVAIEVVAP